MGSLCGTVKAGRGMAARAGVGKVYQLWIGKGGGGGAKGCEEGTMTWVGMVGTGAGGGGTWGRKLWHAL